MGSTSYDYSARETRATTSGFHTLTRDAIFTQSKEQKAHKDMSPKGLKLREARDSDVHPNTVPTILALDVTGSMRQIPHEMIKNGLPTLMSKLIQSGIPDAALLFLGIGDHEYDREPVQVGQFESGDAELDLWLTRTYLEGGGGPNRGESYLLAWYVAAFHTVTDAWEKRGKKGFLFTVGDEPNLNSITASALKGIFGEGQYKTMTSQELLEKAREKWNVYHFYIEHEGREVNQEWKDALGQNLIVLSDYAQLPDKIAEIELQSQNVLQPSPVAQAKGEEETLKPDFKPGITL